MNILSVGAFSFYGDSNTCTHRTQALERLFSVKRIDTSAPLRKFWFRVVNRLFTKHKLSVCFPRYRFNDEIIEAIRQEEFDILWIDKGILIKPDTLRQVKALRPDCLIVGYSPDNMVERHNQSQDFLDTLQLYDTFVTTKSYTVETLYQLGCRHVLFVNNAYEDSFHKPYDLSPLERERLGGSIGFIGSWEQERAETILYLAERGLPIRIWGGGSGWLKYKGHYPNLIIEEQGLFTEDYNKAIAAFDISLCFLRKMNKDLQTTRTMEIPACGGLLVAERTEEHMELFEDGREALFFSSNEELFQLCSYYLEHPEERKQIAARGMERCLKSGYSNKDTLERAIRIIIQYHKGLS